MECASRRARLPGSGMPLRARAGEPVRREELLERSRRSAMNSHFAPEHDPGCWCRAPILVSEAELLQELPARPRAVFVLDEQQLYRHNGEQWVVQRD